jgi:hypothetical protein
MLEPIINRKSRANKPQGFQKMLYDKLQPNDFRSMQKAKRTAFKNIIKFLSNLKSNMVINDDEFSDFVNFVCSVYVEHEIEQRVNKVLTDKIHVIFSRENNDKEER